MPVEDEFTSLGSLADRRIFAQIYSEVANAITSAHALKLSISPSELDSAFDCWVLNFEKTLPRRYSDHRRLVVAVKSIIGCLLTRKTIRCQPTPPAQ